MGKKKDMLRELAGRIYDLDVEVYEKLGSSLGRVFNQERERCIKELMKLMDSKSKSHILRSQLALISNMARTIEDDLTQDLIMKKYGLNEKERILISREMGRLPDLSAINHMKMET